MIFGRVGSLTMLLAFSFTRKPLPSALPLEKFNLVKEVLIMKSILVIGLGRFGRHITRKLLEEGNSVLAVEKKTKSVQTMLSTFCRTFRLLMPQMRPSSNLLVSITLICA